MRAVILALVLLWGCDSPGLDQQAQRADEPQPPDDDPRRAPATDWTMYGGNPQRSFATADKTIEEDTVFRLEEKWRFVIPNPDATNSVTASPTVYQGRVYFGDWHGQFYAVDAVDGALVWERDLLADLRQTLEATLPAEEWDMLDERAIHIYSTALAHEGVIYTGISQLMYALDAETGDTLWKKNLLDPLSRQYGDNGAGFFSSPTVALNPDLGRDVIYVGAPSIDCVRGVLRAIDPRSGAFLWSYYLDGGSETVAGEITPAGDPAMGGGLWTSPTLSPDGRTVFITSSNACGNPPQPTLAPALVALRTSTRALSSTARIRWVARPRSFDLDDRAIANTPNYMANVITPGGGLVDLVGYADKDGSYRAYFAEDVNDDGQGDLVWRTDVAPSSDERTGGGFVGGGTGFADNRVFAGSFLGPPFMHAFEAWTGEVAWQSPIAAPTFGGVGIANHMVFKGDEFGPGLKVYDAADGFLLNLLPAQETVAGAPAILDRHVIVTLGSSRPWEGLPTHPQSIGAMAFYLSGEGLRQEIPPIDPNPLGPPP